jgi:class 3 adenylate cyclase
MPEASSQAPPEIPVPSGTDTFLFTDIEGSTPGLRTSRCACAWGIHTGEPWSGEVGYVGMDVHRAARIAHGG